MKDNVLVWNEVKWLKCNDAILLINAIGFLEALFRKQNVISPKLMPQLWSCSQIVPWARPAAS
jgi:hypothetical protein